MEDINNIRAKKHNNKLYGFDSKAFGKGMWKELSVTGGMGKIADKETQNILNSTPGEMSLNRYRNRLYGFDEKAFGKGMWKEVTATGNLGSKVAPKHIQERFGNPKLANANIENLKASGLLQTIDGKNYAFDTVQKVWKKVSSSGKLAGAAPKTIQEKLGNIPSSSSTTPQSLSTTPQPTQPTTTSTIPQPTPKKIEDPTERAKELANRVAGRQAQRLRRFREMIIDPNETLISSARKAIRQSLFPERVVSKLFGRTAGLITGKALNVSQERLNTLAYGFFGDYYGGYGGRRIHKPESRSIVEPKTIVTPKRRDTTTKLETNIESTEKESTPIESYVSSGSNVNSQKLHDANVKTHDLLLTSNSYLKIISDYFVDLKEKEPTRERVTGRDFRPNRSMSNITASPTDNKGSGLFSSIFDTIISGLGFGAAAGAGAGAAVGIGAKILKTMGRVLIGFAKKLPIVGPILMAAFGLKDAYDEYMAGGDFEDSIGTFFESFIDNLTFGLVDVKSLNIKETISTTLKELPKKWDDFVDWIKKTTIDPILSMVDSIKDAISGVINPIFEKLRNFSFTIPEIPLIDSKLTGRYSIGPWTFQPFKKLFDDRDTSGVSTPSLSDVDIEESKRNEPKIIDRNFEPIDPDKITNEMSRDLNQDKSKSYELKSDEELAEEANKWVKENIKPQASYDYKIQPRRIGEIIDQKANQLASTQDARREPEAIPSIVNNVTNNNSTNSGKYDGRTASVRNEDNTIIRIQNAVMATAAL